MSYCRNAVWPDLCFLEPLHEGPCEPDRLRARARLRPWVNGADSPEAEIMFQVEEDARRYSPDE